MTTLAMNNNDDLTLDNGCKYVFAYYSSKDKCWYVQPRRFFLIKNENRQILSGQFIQSHWFNVLYMEGMIALFVVLKVKKEMSGNTIEKDMNSLKNPFPSLYDIPPYALRASYFSMPWDILRLCMKESNNKDDFKFTMRASNSPWDKLTVQIYKAPEGKGILICCPEFEMPLC